MKTTKGVTVKNNMNRKQWLAERKKGIGGSDIAAIMGLNKYKTPLDVWRDKQPDAVELAQNQDMLRGVLLEEFVAKMWASLSDNTVRKPAKMIYTHPEYSFAKASPDRFYGGKNPSILECKTIARQLSHDDLPDYWVCQLQWTLFCTRTKVGTIAWCSPPGFSIEWMEFEADAMMHELMLDAARGFWENYVVTGNQPPPITGEDVISVFPKENPEKKVEATEDALALVIKYRDMLDAEKTIQSHKKAIADELKSFINDAYAMTYGDKVIATYKARKDGVKVDESLLIAKYPEVYKQVIVPALGPRVLLIKGE